MSALVAVLYREGLIRATNVTFIVWDICFPIAYLLVFGVGVDQIVFAGRKPIFISQFESFAFLNPTGVRAWTHFE